MISNVGTVIFTLRDLNTICIRFNLRYVNTRNPRMSIFSRIESENDICQTSFIVFSLLHILYVFVISLTFIDNVVDISVVRRVGRTSTNRIDRA